MRFMVPPVMAPTASKELLFPMRSNRFIWENGKWSQPWAMWVSNTCTRRSGS